MDELVSLLLGESTSLDVYVIVRIVVLALCLEFVGNMVSSLRGGRR